MTDQERTQKDHNYNLLYVRSKQILPATSAIANPT